MVLVEGVRTPFVTAGTVYKELTPYDLGKTALKSLINRTGLDPKLIDHIYFGNVIQVHVAPCPFRLLKHVV